MTLAGRRECGDHGIACQGDMMASIAEAVHAAASGTKSCSGRGRLRSSITGGPVNRQRLKFPLVKYHVVQYLQKFGLFQERELGALNEFLSNSATGPSLPHSS